MRMWGSLAVVCALGIPVLIQMGVPGAERAVWYSWAVAAVGLAMCWGGVESSRWILRDSPLAKTSTPASDWAKLWVYSGVPSGAFMLFWLGLGWLLHSWLSAAVNTVIIGQALLGPAVWLVAVPFIVKDLQPSAVRQEGISVKIAGALLLHAVGVMVALWAYPHFVGASLTALFALISSLSALYPLVFFHMLLIGVALRLQIGTKSLRA